MRKCKTIIRFADGSMLTIVGEYDCTVDAAIAALEVVREGQKAHIKFSLKTRAI